MTSLAEKRRELRLLLQSPPLSGTNSILHKYTNGHHHQQQQQQQQQPPRPESRSDSYAKTESFLRDHSRMMAGSSLSSHSTIVNNHVAFDEASIVSTSSRYPSRPESRNQNGYYGMCNGGPKKDLAMEVTEVLTNHHHHQNRQNNNYNNNNNNNNINNNSSTDPLVSLIESLSEIGPLSNISNGCTSVTSSSSIVADCTTNNLNNGFDKPNDRTLDSSSPLMHESSRHQRQQSSNCVGHNSINNSYSTPNQSPKAWQSISTTQVRFSTTKTPFR